MSGYTWRRIDEVDGRVYITTLRMRGVEYTVEVTCESGGAVVPSRVLPGDLGWKLTDEEGYGFRKAS